MTQPSQAVGGVKYDKFQFPVGELLPVFENGNVLRKTTLAEIRQRLHGDTF